MGIEIHFGADQSITQQIQFGRVIEFSFLWASKKDDEGENL
jgi:hypothetical protein